MSEIAANANPPGFFRQLVMGPGGLPDEAAVSYLVAQAVIVAGTIYNTIITSHFPILDFTGQRRRENRS
jgi:hypothetical protein